MTHVADTRNMKDDIKKTMRTLYLMGNEIEDCVYLLLISFLNNSMQHVNDCRKRLMDIIHSEDRITSGLEELKQENPVMSLYVEVPAHFSAIGSTIEKLSGIIDKKISEHILFGNKSVEEITFLLQRLLDLLRPTSDIILARNYIMGRYVQESEADIVKRASEYTALHNKRLTEGVCQTAASPLYLGMIDSVKSISWHAKQIATKLMH